MNRGGGEKTFREVESDSTLKIRLGPTVHDTLAMSCFGYRRELSKYEDVDEDELLASLSPEELAELEKELTDIDPDANVPTGLRQRDQTDKTPTGTFSRDALMKYWESETRKLLEDEISGGSPKTVGLKRLFAEVVD